jgi:hypothetical protein
VKLVAARNTTRAVTVAERTMLADRWWLRLRGLLFRPRLSAGEGLLLFPCRAVHMAGMRYPIDVMFLAPDGEVVALYHDLRRGARSRWHRNAASALELPAGTIAATGTVVGDTILCSAQESV